MESLLLHLPPPEWKQRFPRPAHGSDVWGQRWEMSESSRACFSGIGLFSEKLESGKTKHRSAMLLRHLGYDADRCRLMQIQNMLVLRDAILDWLKKFMELSWISVGSLLRLGMLKLFLASGRVQCSNRTDAPKLHLGCRHPALLWNKRWRQRGHWSPCSFSVCTETDEKISSGANTVRAALP